MLWYRNVGPDWWPRLEDSVRSHEAEHIELGGRVWSELRTQNNGVTYFSSLFPPDLFPRPGQMTLSEVA